MKHTHVLVILFLAIILQLYGWFIFGSGFFPIKKPLEGLSTLNDQFHILSHQDHNKSLQLYDKCIIIIIDALRSDFIFNNTLNNNIISNYSNTLPFIHSLIHSKASLPFIGLAQAPTVTLPRIKALVSGSFPSFWDFIDNFHSPSLKQDSLVHQFKQYNWNTCFYGDDTWLRLYPIQDNYFIRYEGTTSFFVSDTIQVDNNVTRCLYNEIYNNYNHSYPCDALILHYLGLDHIGHYQGPRSSLLIPKLQEMDSIIKEIYNYSLHYDNQRCSVDNKTCGTLIMITGDHGMNELGNHGGSSQLETHTGVLFIDPKWNKSQLNITLNTPLQVNQVDLIPSLSLLLGLPIPKNNLGTIIPSLFTNHSLDNLLNAFQINAYQLIKVIQGNSIFWKDDLPQTQETQEIWDEYESLSLLVSSLYSIHTSIDYKNNQLPLVIERYNTLVHTMSNIFIQLLTEYDELQLLYGGILLFISCLCYTYLLGYLIYHIDYKNFYLIHKIEWILFIGCFFLFYCSLFTSSFVEEEHQTWYFISTTIFICYILLFSIGKRDNYWIIIQYICEITITLLLQRIMRFWNYTGVKWIHLIDYGDYIEDILKPYILLFFVIISIIFIFICYLFGCLYLSQLNILYRIYLVIIGCFSCICLFLCKYQQIIPESILLDTYILNNYIQLSYIFLIITIISLFIIIIRFSLQTTNNTNLLYYCIYLRIPILILLMFLHKPRNIFLLLLIFINSLMIQRNCNILHKYYDKTNNYQYSIRLICIILIQCKCSYFLLGTSNNLASIDIGGAYTGLTYYNELIVGIFAGLIMYSGPIINLFILFDYIICLCYNQKQVIIILFIIFNVTHGYLLFIFSCVIYILRYHLFIWSVFSPKYLFESLHSGFLLFINLLFVLLYIIIK